MHTDVVGTVRGSASGGCLGSEESGSCDSFGIVACSGRCPAWGWRLVACGWRDVPAGAIFNVARFAVGKATKAGTVSQLA